jgi:hypothetical protein
MFFPQHLVSSSFLDRNSFPQQKLLALRNGLIPQHSFIFLFSTFDPQHSCFLGKKGFVPQQSVPADSFHNFPSQQILFLEQVQESSVLKIKVRLVVEPFFE